MHTARSVHLFIYVDLWTCPLAMAMAMAEISTVFKWIQVDVGVAIDIRMGLIATPERDTSGSVKVEACGT